MEYRALSIILIILSLSFLGGCTDKNECEDPFIRIGYNCCIDTNHDNVCDHGDEVYTKTASFDIAETTPHETLQEMSERKQQEKEDQEFWDMVVD